MKLSYKIYGVIATVLIMMLTVAGVSINSMNNIGTLLVEIAEEDIPLTGITTEITINQLEQALWLERAIGAAGTNRNESRMLEAEREFERRAELVNEELKEAEALAAHGAERAHNEAARQKFVEVEAGLREIEKSHSAFDRHAEELFEALNAGHVAQATQAIANIEVEEEALDHRLEAFLLDLEQFTEEATLEAEHMEQAALKTLIAIAIAGLIIGIVVGFFLTRSIIGPIHSAAEIMQQMSEGNLSNSIKVNSSDEIGQLTSQMADMQHKLTEIVSKIQQASASVKTGADEISQGNTNLSQRSEEQASSLEETASSMEEMTATVKQNADNSSEANQLAKAAREQAEKGGSVVSQAVEAMDEINASSKKISDIIGVIDQIAVQTNLLALNASVEAARAGDQGRGFAVVASEVRNLAGRSATAAKEIKELIDDSASKVDDGSRLVNQAGETLGEIVIGVKKVSDIVGEIAAASQEQSAGIEEVNKAIMQMDEMTQQNSALVEQAAAASESLGDQANDLNLMMEFFTVERGTQASVAASGRPAESGERRSADHRPRGGVKRRSADRPWTAPETAQESEEVAAPAAQRKAAANGGDREWGEF